MGTAWRKRLAFSLFSKIVIVFLAMLIAGCMRPPKFPRRVSVEDVVNNIRCELYSAVSGYYKKYGRRNYAGAPTFIGGMKDNGRSNLAHISKINDKKAHWLEEWGVGFDLSLVVAREVDASTDVTRVIPVTHGTFTHRLRAGLDRDAKSTYVFNFKILNLRNWHKYECSEQADYNKRRRLLSGELGLKRWLDQVLPEIEASHLQNATKDDTIDRKKRRAYEGEVSKLAHTIEFGIGINGSILPSWSLAYANGVSIRPMFDFGRKRKVTHKLITTMNKKNVAGAKDRTWVIYTDKHGTKSLVSRRVCLRKSGSIKECPDINFAKQKREAEQKYQKILSEQINSQRQYKQALRGVEKQVIEQERQKLISTPDNDFTKSRKPTDQQLRQLFDISGAVNKSKRLKEAGQKRDDANRRLIEAKKNISELKEEQKELEESLKFLQAREEIEDNQIFERQLENSLTAEIIRDSLRTSQ